MYFVTCMEKNGKEIVKGKPDYGDTRTFGYTETYAEAEDALNVNSCDMHEYLYLYAVIENIPEGKIIRDKDEEENRTWFAYDQERDGFFNIEKPNQNETKGWISLF